MSKLPEGKLEIRDRPIFWAILGALFGLLSGLAEVTALGVKKNLLERYLHLSLHTVWMSPLGAIIFFQFSDLHYGLLPLGGVASLCGISD